MRKAQGCGGAMIRLIGILLLLALVGYNTWETARLRAEVYQLQHDRLQAPAKITAAQESSVGIWGEARRHAERAETLLRNKQYTEASREISLAATATRKASDSARTQSAGTLNELRSTVDALSRSAGTLSKTAAQLWQNGEESSPEHKKETVKKP